MSVLSFKTILNPSDGHFRDRGSHFLAFAFPVRDEKEVKTKLAELRKKFHDASHQGYAFVLGPEQKVWRAFDDGEPNHSTGDPILGQIRTRQLTNVLVVVVRYFGGTKLGVSGLIAAYRTAASEALSKATIVEEEVVLLLDIAFAFDATPSVMKLIKAFNITIISQEFTEKAFMRLEVPVRTKDKLLDKLTLLKAKGFLVDWSEPSINRS
jgi:uncharacterized YigZ family protein